MKRIAFAAQGDRGHETLGGGFKGPLTTTAYRAQILASRYALTAESAAIIAALAWEQMHHV